MIHRNVREWESLSYGTGDDRIPLWAAERLAAVASRSPLGGANGGSIITLGHKALRAGQVVGILAADGVELEILPKIDVKGDSKVATGQIRRKLVHMLAVAFEMEIDGGALTGVDPQRDHLLEILIGLFSKKLVAVVRQGMPRQYLTQEDDLRALRGRLDMARQFSLHAANPSRLACRFDELSPDIALNQVMKAAVTRLRRLARTPDNLRRLAELDFAYADVSTVPLHSLRWDALQIDRTNAHWRNLLAMARLLLGDQFQTSAMGEQPGFSLLFEMNTLFEQYVGQLLRRAMGSSGLSVHLQGGGRYCLTSMEDGRQIFQTRPDILIKRGEQVVHIIDTKWKRIGGRVDDPKRGVSQSDVYQMMAYAQVYSGCELLTLLYPHHSDSAVDEGIIGEHRIGAGTSQLRLASIALDGAIDTVTSALQRLAAA